MNRKEGLLKLPKFSFHSLKHLVERSFAAKPSTEIRAILSPVNSFKRERSRYKMNRCGISFRHTKPKQDSQSTNEFTEGHTMIDTKKGFDIYHKLLIKKNIYRAYNKYTELTASDHIHKILYNDKAHIVAAYKEFLIYEDIKELLAASCKKQASKLLLPNLAKGAASVFATYRTSSHPIIKRALGKKVKANKDLSECKENISTIFLSNFYDSLAKEDLSNSASELPLNCNVSSGERSMSGLLNELHELSRESIKNETKDKPLALNKLRKENIAGNKLKKKLGKANEEASSLNSIYDISLLKKKVNLQARNRNAGRLALATISSKRTEQLFPNKLDEVKSSNRIRILCRSGVGSKAQLSGAGRPKITLKDQRLKSNYFAVYGQGKSHCFSQGNSSKSIPYNTANSKVKLIIKKSSAKFLQSTKASAKGGARGHTLRLSSCLSEKGLARKKASPQAL